MATSVTDKDRMFTLNENRDESAEIHSSIETVNLYFYYKKEIPILKNINLNILQKNLTAIIGPSGCGKTTLIRCFNRLNDLITDTIIRGKIFIEGKDIYHSKISTEDLRKKVGMVFQKPNPFSMSIWENVSFGPKINGLKNHALLEERVELSLQLAGLWNEVRDQLDESALSLSLGQQQRLCIARALANQPDIILLDEPASALDPISTGKLEDTIESLKQKYTIVLVTHNMQQAARLSEYTAFLMMGELIEFNDTKTFFTNPTEKLTEEYITGRFG
jgi:phosphate transport system ATP-binding protein